MVSELHRMGYQNLRIMPYEYPLAWRLTIAPKRIFAIRNGAFVPSQRRYGLPDLFIRIRERVFRMA